CILARSRYPLDATRSPANIHLDLVHYLPSGIWLPGDFMGFFGYVQPSPSDSFGTCFLVAVFIVNLNSTPRYITILFIYLYTS
ncbi:unnamed protein product, partial [Schistosoma intercalatum]